MCTESELVLAEEEANRKAEIEMLYSQGSGRCFECKHANIFRFLRGYHPQFQCVKSGEITEEGSDAILQKLRSFCTVILPSGAYAFQMDKQRNLFSSEINPKKGGVI